MEPYHTFRKLDAEGVEHIVRVFQDPEPESPKHAYLNPVQENKPVLFVTAESSWNYTDAVMDVVYPSVGNSWEDLLDYAISQLESGGQSAHWSHAPLWVHEHGGICRFHTGGRTCQWDSYQCGWAIARPGVTEEMIQSYVKEMEMYLTGEVKLIEYENSNGEHELAGHIYDDTVNYEHCLEVAYGLGYPKPATVEQALVREEDA